MPIKITGLAPAFIVLCAYQAQAQEYCKLGSENWIAACQAACTASWEGSDCPRSCSATPPAGHVIMDHRVNVNSQNNGGHDVSRISAGQEFNYSRQVEQAYQYAIDAAGKAGNKSAEAKLKNDMRTAISEAESFKSSHQMIRLNVNASKHGSVFDRKRGWSNVSVDMLIKCIVPANLEQQLMEKYALN